MIDHLVRLLAQNPLLLLFLVAAIGFPLGHLRLRGSRLGVAAVLFVGLAAGALSPTLALPEIIYMLGLAIFVYTVGLSSGPAFVASLRRGGLRHNALALGVLGLALLLALLAQRLLGLGAPLTAGLFAGALTNTPALAGAIETLKQSAAPGALGEPVVAYSITYPMGVIGVVLAIRLAIATWKPDLAAEARKLGELGAANDPLTSWTIEVEQQLGALTLDELKLGLGWRVIFGRLKRDGKFQLCDGETRLALGDQVVAVGTEAALERVARRLGRRGDEPLDFDRSEFDMRRIFVSDRAVAGIPLKDLGFAARFGAVITRVRRGDVDLLPHDLMRLELGDRVRVLAPVKRLPEVTAWFGDSYRAVSEVDVLTFGLGLALGLLLGILPLPLPGGLRVTLGFAGGPLIMALLLGTLERTGPLVWSLPYSANTTLRQIGLVLFLAGIGTRAGSGFLATFTSGSGLALFGAGALLTFVTAFTALAIGYRLLRIPMSLLVGMVAGIQTQPAVLGYALEQTGNEIPNLGYAAVYPAATIGKILLVQVLLALA
jgi:putative transport protein